MIVMVGVWLNKYLGGFAWDGSAKEFNLHPLCMVCGIIFLYGEGKILYCRTIITTSCLCIFI